MVVSIAEPEPVVHHGIRRQVNGFGVLTGLKVEEVYLFQLVIQQPNFHLLLTGIDHTIHIDISGGHRKGEGNAAVFFTGFSTVGKYFTIVIIEHILFAVIGAYRIIAGLVAAAGKQCRIPRSGISGRVQADGYNAAITEAVTFLLFGFGVVPDPTLSL